MTQYLLLATLVICTLCLYEGNSPVKHLTQETFPKMLSSKHMWVIEFYSPQCGHCVQAAPHFEKAATITEGIIHFGAVDMTKYPSLGSKYQIRGYPTFKFFGGNKQAPVDYNGQRTAQDFVQFALTQTKDVITNRANGQKEGGSGRSSGGDKQGKRGGVVEITDANFEEKVLKSDEAWFLDFYSPQCGHCQTLEPEFGKLPKMMEKKVRIAKIDASVNRDTASKYSIKGYPTLIFFPKGAKSETTNYNGERSSEAMASWLNSQKIGSAKVQLQELSKSTYTQQCQRNNVCVLILVQNDEQLKQLSFLEETIQRHSSQPIKYLYTKGVLNSLQSDLMIDDRNYPKVLSLLSSRNSFKILNKPLEMESLKGYLKETFTSNWIRLSKKIEDYLFVDGEL